MVVNYECYECGFKGDRETIGRKVECPNCKVVNDVWREGEKPPSNHRGLGEDTQP